MTEARSEPLTPSEIEELEGLVDRYDGAPSHESGRFVEVEDETGKSINVGEWLQRPDGYWVLRLVRPESRSGDTETAGVALAWARKLDAAATRHDRASTEAERKAASRDINDLILDVERMVQIARALLATAE